MTTKKKKKKSGPHAPGHCTAAGWLCHLWAGAFMLPAGCPLRLTGTGCRWQLSYTPFLKLCLNWMEWPNLALKAWFHRTSVRAQGDHAVVLFYARASQRQKHRASFFFGVNSQSFSFKDPPKWKRRPSHHNTGRLPHRYWVFHSGNKC